MLLAPSLAWPAQRAAVSLAPAPRGACARSVRWYARRAAAPQPARDGDVCCTGATAAAAQPSRGEGSAGDVVALSNLCVDIVQQVSALPPREHDGRRALYTQLVASSPPQSSWEVGGNTNFAIAAARLGLGVTCLGHTGPDVYGTFMEQVLAEEGVALQQLLAPGEEAPPTLLCWVLIDPQNGHAFCSRFDFDTKPLLSCSSNIPAAWTATLTSAKAVFVNGFVFDDLEPSTVVAAVRTAQAAGAEIFFDAGPRVRALLRDAPAGAAAAVRELFAIADGVLLTQEEAEIVTGLKDAEAAAASLLARNRAVDPWVVVKKGSRGCIALTRGERASLPALEVEALDTVGCGDSFAAAVVLGRIRSHALHTTLALANAVGAATATGRGAGRNVARAEHVAELLDAAASDGAAMQEARTHAAAARDVLLR